MYKWIIVGGGIQGCTIAVQLLQAGKVSTQELLIIDPYSRPMHKWLSLTEKIGMTYLRSPFVHHMDTRPFALKDFAEKNDYTKPFLGRYKRPQLQLFNDHCKSLFDQLHITKSWHQATVRQLKSVGTNAWSVETDQNTFTTERVVLAMGVNDNPYWPGWAIEAKSHYPKKVSHLFTENSPPPSSVCVVGGGLTAAHMAVLLCENPGVEKVTLIKRHDFRVHDFDSDPGWLGPKYLNNYHKIISLPERRATIKEARNRGSIPREMFLKLKRLEADGSLKCIDDEIQDVSTHLANPLLHFKRNQSESFEGIYLATGSAQGLPEEIWLKHVIDRESLQCADCGFPIVTKQLEWKKGLHVAGPLAELEIGPVSRNISGARKAAAILSSISI
ncbi:FAD/NAD(P)-binding protein [Oceanobacillus manasiensis]|uniref:FAD/NAD(P)-binding protein n=1 Tax=Oceanobacillus manasiensis TaxID=586413 RepID=UPI0005A5D584|nr:FAD/NAD(P)-binding protein [Oceanobacillus manasiensis]